MNDATIKLVRECRARLQQIPEPPDKGTSLSSIGYRDGWREAHHREEQRILMLLNALLDAEARAEMAEFYANGHTPNDGDPQDCVKCAESGISDLDGRHYKTLADFRADIERRVKEEG